MRAIWIGVFLVACGGGDKVFDDAGSGQHDARADASGAQPDASHPDSAMPDASIPDAVVPDALVPDAFVPDASPPDATAINLASCAAIHAANPSLPSGTYSIQPGAGDGGAPFDATCDMTTDGGGWTKVTTPVADSLASGVAREYLYLYNDRWYRSPCSTLVWSWSAGQQLTGDYAWWNGTTAGSLTCTGSAELPFWGVGCSNGPGGTLKVLPIYSDVSVNGESEICQDLPDAYGAGACALGVGIYEREGCTP